MVDFHNLLLVIIIVICVFVLALVGYVVVRFNAKRNPVPSRTSHNTVIEVIWTVVPVLVLLVIAIPSFRLLYFLDRAENPEMTVQATGSQWYWGYQLPDQQIEEFASYIVAAEDLKAGQPPLLTTDNTLRSGEHTSKLQPLMPISYAVFCLNTKKTITSYTISI